MKQIVFSKTKKVAGKRLKIMMKILAAGFASLSCSYYFYKQGRLANFGERMENLFLQDVVPRFAHIASTATIFAHDRKSTGHFIGPLRSLSENRHLFAQGLKKLLRWNTILRQPGLDLKQPDGIFCTIAQTTINFSGIKPEPLQPFL